MKAELGIHVELAMAHPTTTSNPAPPLTLAGAAAPVDVDGGFQEATFRGK